MNRRTTIREVAKQAEVSISTVSNYLNGRFGNMSSQTRDRVAAAIESLGYYPSLGAQALPRKRQTHTICIVIPHNVDYTFHHTYFAEVMRGIAGILDDNGYRAMILTTKDKGRAEVSYLRSLTRGIVDGIIFFDVEERDPFIDAFGESSLPVMFVGRADKAVTRFVDNDVEDGAAKAAEHLISLGHRRVTLLAGPQLLMFTKQLIAGVHRAFKNAGLEWELDQVVYGEFSEASGMECAVKVFSKSTPATAVFAASGKQALGFMEYARKHGFAIPDSVSLISFGHHPVVGALGRRLTYLDQPEVDVGSRVALKLLEQIEGKDADDAVAVMPEVLPLTLVVGESTGPPAGT